MSIFSLVVGIVLVSFMAVGGCSGSGSSSGESNSDVPKYDITNEENDLIEDKTLLEDFRQDNAPTEDVPIPDNTDIVPDYSEPTLVVQGSVYWDCVRRDGVDDVYRKQFVFYADNTVHSVIQADGGGFRYAYRHLGSELKVDHKTFVNYYYIASLTHTTLHLIKKRSVSHWLFGGGTIYSDVDYDCNLRDFPASWVVGN